MRRIFGAPFFHLNQAQAGCIVANQMKNKPSDTMHLQSHLAVQRLCFGHMQFVRKPGPLVKYADCR